MKKGEEGLPGQALAKPKVKVMGHISRLVLENFTAFAQFDQEFYEWVNVFIGQNGAGKTHVPKVLHSSRSLFVFSSYSIC